jgi:hypothetical protein
MTASPRTRRPARGHFAASRVLLAHVGARNALTGALVHGPRAAGADAKAAQANSSRALR